MVFGCFGEHAAAVKCVVYDLSNGGRFWINIHPVTGAQMSNNPFGRYVQSYSSKLRITTRLNMVNSKKPLIQRQVRIKSHDCVHSSK